MANRSKPALTSDGELSPVGSSEWSIGVTISRMSEVRDDDSTAAAQLSPGFLSGSTKVGLEKIRTRLLDPTNGNRLLNFRHTSASSIRVVGTHPNVVFRRLIEGEKLTVLAVPEMLCSSPTPATSVHRRQNCRQPAESFLSLAPRKVERGSLSQRSLRPHSAFVAMDNALYIS